jgi:hypothetical protein
MNLPGVRCSRFALPSFRRKRSRQVPRHSKLEFASALSERFMCLRDRFRIPNGLAHHWIPISVKPLELPLRLLSGIQNAFTSRLLFWWLMRLLKLGLADPDDADPPPTSHASQRSPPPCRPPAARWHSASCRTRTSFPSCLARGTHAADAHIELRAVGRDVPLPEGPGVSERGRSRCRFHVLPFRVTVSVRSHQHRGPPDV